jgi:hypothetical protein
VTCGESGMVAKMVAANTKPTIVQAFMFLVLPLPMGSGSPGAGGGHPLPRMTRKTKGAEEPMLFNIAHSAPFSRKARKFYETPTGSIPPTNGASSYHLCPRRMAELVPQRPIVPALEAA